MQLGMVGLGRMGANIVRRLMRDGHECVVYDVNPEFGGRPRGEGATGSTSPEDFVGKLEQPRAVWVMIPAGITGKIVDQFAALLDEGDIIIDGGNSNYRDDVRRAKKLREQGIHYVDIGTSGGVFGLERGYCLMVGGDDEAVTTIDPLLKTIAPGPGDIDRTPGRDGDLGAGGAGLSALRPVRRRALREDGPQRHRVRHHGRLRRGPEHPGQRRRRHPRPASTPPRSPRWRSRSTTSSTSTPAKVSELWRRGSVISSWLLDLTAAALHANPNLDGLAGRVSDSGEGRWTVKAAVDIGVPAPVLAASLFERFASRDEDHFANQVLSAMRQQFGGHAELPAGTPLEAGGRQSRQGRGDRHRALTGVGSAGGVGACGSDPPSAPPQAPSPERPTTVLRPQPAPTSSAVRLGLGGLDLDRPAGDETLGWSGVRRPSAVGRFPVVRGGRCGARRRG